MSTLDPFLNNADGIGEPYQHAHAINPVDLIMGDVELPFVSSAVYFGSTVHHVKLTLLGGAEVTLAYVKASTLLPLRVTKVKQQPFYEGVQPYDGVLPHGLVALW